MTNLNYWKPWYARIPGAFVAAVGTVIAFPLLVPVMIFGLPLMGGIYLMDKGLDMMQRTK